MTRSWSGSNWAMTIAREAGDDDMDRLASVGRLVAPGAADDGVDLDDEEPDAVADRADATDLSAEEAAVHLTGAPPFRPAERLVGGMW